MGIVRATLPTALERALADLERQSIPWFDDNPLAWEGPTELPYGEPTSLWDTVTILKYQFVGEVRGKISTKLDVKERTGQNGATLTNNGQKNTPIDITLYLLTPRDLVNYAAMLRKVFQMSNARQAVEVNHPALAIHHLSGAGPQTALYLFDVDLIRPPRNGEPGSVTLHFHQFTVKQSGQKVNGTAKFAPQPVPTAVSGNDPPAPPKPTPPSSNISPPQP